MNFFKRLFGKKKQDQIELSSDEIIGLGVCPNCWGRQEYGDEYREYNYDSTKSNINHDKAHQKAFIAQFVETHITGIKLNSDNSRLVCPRCNTAYNN